MRVKKNLPYLYLLILSVWCNVSRAQTQEPIKLAFQDSIRVMLENTKSVDATAIGASFGNLWGNLSDEQQTLIRKQVKWMKKRAARIQPQYVNYYGAITSAIDIEKLDATKFTAFLKAVDKSMGKLNLNDLNVILQQARVFFQFHSLTYEKFFHLKISDDSYDISFVEPPTPDTTAAPYDPVADSIAAAMPQWKKPITQPQIFGLAIVFNKATLNFVTAYDSVFLKNTKGTFSLRDKIFVGDGGSFEWSVDTTRVDSLSKSSNVVTYEFGKYNFKTTQPAFTAAQGGLLYEGKLAGKVPGILEYKSVKRARKALPIYPRFKSYENNVTLLDLDSGKVRYTGGFSLEGTVMTSQSVSKLPATIEIGDVDAKKFKATSPYFTLKKSLIVGSSASVVIYQGSDSITHPSMNMRYRYDSVDEVYLTKDKSSLRKTPLSSSYFKVDFDADAIRWNLKADSLDIYKIGSAGIAPMIIESQNFYDPEDFRLLKGDFDFNPFVLFVKHAVEANTQDYQLFDLVSPRFTIGVLRMAADFLSQKGMVDYNVKNGTVHIKDKAIHFLKSSKNETDYDNIKIHSMVDTIVNATLNFKKNELIVHGVDEFKISDSLKVTIKADTGTISFLHNRGIKFDGVLEAGSFEITGKKFTFNYDSFLVDLQHIDSIRFYVTNKDGSRRLINNSMVGSDSAASSVAGLMASANKTSGTLYINHPDNKSGKEKYFDYPRLDASAGGSVYFDRKDIFGGVYDRSIFFVVPPFKIDSVNDADPASINFEGTFFSDGMFPVFKERMHTMPDNSMGFTHVVPSDGYQLYKSDGKFYGGIQLDHQGIRGHGKIDYLASTVESKDFIYYRDSVTAKIDKGEIREEQIGSVNYPQVTFSNVQMKWLSKQDRLRVKSTTDPFALYKNTAKLNGSLMVTKKGVSGAGKMTTRGSEVGSREMSFSSKDFQARHARFDVKPDTAAKPALAGRDVRINFKLDENYATISPEVEGVAAIDFPYSQFKTSIPQARWDLNTQKITMTKSPNDPIESSYFYTTRKDLDSLRFNAEQAEYDIQKQELKVKGIPYIIVADGKITPENNEVLILKDAKIGQLKNTVIVFDTVNNYHRLTNGVVDIISRKKFEGYATYQYVNAANDTFNIKMEAFHLEPIKPMTEKQKKNNEVVPMQTVADGVVSEKDSIRVAPRIFFKGDIVMYATRPALEMKGAVKLNLKKIKNYDTWINYDQGGDEKDILINFDEAVTDAGRKAQAGLYFATDNSLYIVFVSDKKDEADEEFFKPTGTLHFDKESNEFRIDDLKKASGEKLSGVVFNYNEDKQEVHFEGLVNFFKNSPDFKLTSSALGSGNLQTKDIKMNALIMANMNAPMDVYRMMAMQLQEIIKNEGAGEMGDQTELLYKVANIIGEKPTKDYEKKSQQAYTSLATIPQMNVPIVFSNVNLKWSQKQKAFYSEGQLGISNIGSLDVGGGFEGFMEIGRNAEDGAPVFHFFFKASPEAWYYFGYEDNRLMIQTSNEAINDVVAKKSNAAKAKPGQLVFIPGSNDEALAWINKFRKKYYDLEVPYDLSGGSTAVKKKEEQKPETKKTDDGF